MYHCVPNNRRAMDPKPSPPPTRINRRSTTGKSAVDDLDARAVGLRIGFFDGDGFDEGFTHKEAP
jgi:hypothetical protein